MEHQPTRFEFAFSRPMAPVSRLFGVTPRTCEVIVDADDLTARFGRWTVATSLDNVASASVTGPYSFAKVAGPAHLSFSDRGLTFATTTESGVCIKFHEPVTGIDPFGRLRHPGLTVTVADPFSLVDLLEAHMAHM